MKTAREVGYEVGSQHLAKGLSRLFNIIDAKLGTSGNPPYKRPSFWMNLVGGGLCIYLAYSKARHPVDEVLLDVGAYLTTNLWDYIEEMVATAKAPSPASPAFFVPPAKGSEQQTKQTEQTKLAERPISIGGYGVVARSA